MNYKLTTFTYINDDKNNLRRRVYITIRGGLTWQEAKKIRRRGVFLAPEVIKEYDDENPSS